MNAYKVTCEGSLTVDPAQIFIVIARSTTEVVQMMVGVPASANPIRSIEKIFCERVVLE